MNVETAIGRVILRFGRCLETVKRRGSSRSMRMWCQHPSLEERRTRMTMPASSPHPPPSVQHRDRGARWHRVLRPVPDLRLAARREATGWPFRSGTRGVVPTLRRRRRPPSRSSMWRRPRIARSCGSSPSSETVSVFVRIGFYRPYSWAAVSCSWRCSGPPVERSPAWSRAIGSRDAAARGEHARHIPVSRLLLPLRVRRSSGRGVHDRDVHDRSSNERLPCGSSSRGTLSPSSCS